MAKGKKRLILGHGTRFNITEQSPLGDGSRLWAVWDNRTQEFVKSGKARLEFYKYNDALDVRNKLELRYLANKKSEIIV